MAMTSATMTPKVEPNPVLDKKLVLTTAQIAEAQKQMSALAPDTAKGTEDPLEGVKDVFEDEVAAETEGARKLLVEQQNTQQATSGKKISDLIEDDAYNLEVPIAAGRLFNPSFLKVTLKDKNYIPRWCNVNPIRMAQLVAQGFKMVKVEDVVNLNELDMFLDSQRHFVYADLVCMQIPKNIYYEGLRRAFLKSLHATNNKKAAEAGAAFAKSNLTGTLSGSERSYLAQHEAQGTTKPVYNPNIGV
jgi:hypothetical protein